MKGYLGDYVNDSVISFTFTTHSAVDSSPIAPSSSFEPADISIYRMSGNGTFTKKATANGITVTSPISSITGFHGVDIDTSVDTGESTFVWGAGGEYAVVLDPDETVSGIDPMCVLATFSIERVNNVKLVSDKLDSAMEQDGLVYRFTVNALEQAASAAGVPISYAPTSAVRINGVADSGDYTNLISRDDTSMVTGEDAVNGLEVEVVCSSSTVGEIPSLVRVCGRYGGPQQHQVYIQAYNYDTLAYVTLATMQNRSSNFDYVIPLNSHYHSVAGEMKVKFIHSVGSYNTGDHLYLDFVSWEKVLANSTMASDIAQILSLIGVPVDNTISRDIMAVNELVGRKDISSITYNGDGTMNVITFSDGVTLTFGYSSGRKVTATYA